jgi:hypothetical protein
MTIELIDQKTYDRIMSIQKDHPILTFQNDGYEYINRDKFTEKDSKAYEEISTILKDHVRDFVKFFNFYIGRKSGNILLRFDYVWDPEHTHFVGVGYLHVDELLNGFNTVN